MERLTFEGDFCDIAQCTAVPCPSGGNCSQKQVWTRLKEWEDTGVTPETIDVLKKHSKMLSELCDGIGTLRVKELVEADKDGRVYIMPKSDDGTCGSCDHFKRIAGTRSGTCDIKPYCSKNKIKIKKWDDPNGVSGGKRANIMASVFLPDWFVGFGKDESCLFEGTWWDMICFARNVLASPNTKQCAPEFYHPELENSNYGGEEIPYEYVGGADNG